MSLPQLETYRTIGPFDTDSLPDGLRREHRLKSGTWGRLTVHSGEIMMCWDDGSGEAPWLLRAGAVAIVPPERPHHLEEIGPFNLSIEFQRETPASR